MARRGIGIGVEIGMLGLVFLGRLVCVFGGWIFGLRMRGCVGRLYARAI